MKLLVKLFSAVALAAVLWGCSTANDSATINEAGKHPANWVVADIGGDHPAAYLKSSGQCFVCHGNDLKGGMSGISCFSASLNGITCHAQGPSAHPTGFALPENHGVRAKEALGGANGFAFCQQCHGTAFAGGKTPSGVTSSSCIACHAVGAPHSPKPWRGNARTHTNTDTSNAAVCAQCHTAGANLTEELRQSSYATGTPGCFNNTLCHGAVGHPTGWADPAQHGASAKALPGGTSGIAYCKSCHGTDYHGAGAIPSCFSCHASAPHSPAPWRIAQQSSSTRSHTSTDTGNAAACAGCHLNNQRLTSPAAVPGGTTPGCFNSTLCHGVVGHAVGWSSPTVHGAAAKDHPSGSAGFSYCQNCHGAAFNGGQALTTCINNPNANCHGSTVAAPHSPKPWLGSTRSHVTTAEENAAICSVCHLAGANLTPSLRQASYATGTPTCYNNTMCHGNVGDCTGCHSSQQNTYRRAVVGSGGTLANDFGLTSHHAKAATTINQFTCDVCHDQSNHRTYTDGVSVLLTNQNSGAALAYDGTTATKANLETFCVSCHDADGAARLGTKAFTPFYDSSDNTTPPNIGWTVGAMAHSVNMACFNCHGNSSGVAGSTVNPRFNGHGSVTAKLLQDANYLVASPNAYCLNCHDAASANAGKAATDIRGQFALTYRHTTATCFDCHGTAGNGVASIHTLRSGNHTAANATIAGNLASAKGVPVTFSASNWTAPTTGVAITATSEYQICLRCHSSASGIGATALTNLGLEFSTSNQSYHPVVAALPTADPGLNGSSRLASTQLTGWSPGNIMTCSDCHATSQAGSFGPHGSAIKWMLKGTNKAWPYTDASANGTGTGTFFTYNTRTTGNGTDNGLFCLNCHAISSNPHSSAGAHTTIACVGCHVRVPHGGKVSRLINTNTAGRVARYAPDGNNGGTIYLQQFRKKSAGSYQESDCFTGAVCHGNGNGSTPPAAGYEVW